MEKRRDQVSFKDETQDEQNQKAADAERNAAASKSSAATTAIATIFDIAADAARSPAHESPQEGRCEPLQEYTRRNGLAERQAFAVTGR